MVKYYYDGYGSIIGVVDTSGINLSSVNPFRYRSYYQDNETGWYYLNLRYYDPLVKSFITMDDIDYLGASGTALSYNLFSYCENNPVNNVDYDGNKKEKMSATSTLVVGIIGLAANLFKYGRNIFNIFKNANVETIVKIIMSFVVYLPVTLANEITYFVIKNIAATICNFTSTFMYQFISFGLNIGKLTATGLIVSAAVTAMVTIALIYLPKLYDSINMIICGINKKPYYIEKKWYGFKYYNK